MTEPLRLLSIETSDKSGSVAAALGNRLLAERPLAAGQRSAQSLAPGIADLLAHVHWKPADVQLVAVASGPGSFTGLRVGVTTAKTLAYAVRSALVAINTLEVIARQAASSVHLDSNTLEQRIVAVVDAQRGAVFAATYQAAAQEGLVCKEPTHICDDETLLRSLRRGDLLAGPVVFRLADKLPPRVTLAPHDLWHPRAGTIAVLGWEKYCAGQTVNPWSLVPNYFRRSAAEEKTEAQVAEQQAAANKLSAPPPPSQAQ